uniref:Uncharacterized protein n=1 Tax=Rhizophora mucronata TaxID=61149 RepID=A0A2P2QWK6_RHIMU
MFEWIESIIDASGLAENDPIDFLLQLQTVCFTLDYRKVDTKKNWFLNEFRMLHWWKVQKKISSLQRVDGLRHNQKDRIEFPALMPIPYHFPFCIHEHLQRSIRF